MLSRLIDNYYAKSKLDKIFSILDILGSGAYYAASKNRFFIIGNYKALVLSLGEDEYNEFINKLKLLIPSLIKNRDDRKIAYSLLSQIIKYSCLPGVNYKIFRIYEKEIIRLVKINKGKYFYHLITLTQTKSEMGEDISDLEDFVIDKYLTLSKLKSINYKYLIDFTTNVQAANKRKFLLHLMKLKPFRNDTIIYSFLNQHSDLKKYVTLI